ncbi:MAG: hypothetical protein QM299_14745 [Pseudomonadota bacterium]|uniref:LemA family protein n=1 Tax=anaerobic digester metagenome TaxID=1263854 RepID=A0A485LXD0_9ZZZZ|nr:hypothetical protein [Pseudomonadota bacterium]HON39473.1 hypothetical protein [Deltaproteobacteria bacterium]HPX18759.1 hypothetical protein [Deltaproteobacteria bacterium]
MGNRISVGCERDKDQVRTLNAYVKTFSDLLFALLAGVRHCVCFEGSEAEQQTSGVKS